MSTNPSDAVIEKAALDINTDKSEEVCFPSARLAAVTRKCNEIRKIIVQYKK